MRLGKRHRFALGVLCVVLLSGFAIPAAAQETTRNAEATVPEYDGEFFTDLAHQVRGPSKAQISKRLRIAAESSRIHPMLAVIPRMADYPGLPQEIQACATKLATSWKIGDAQTHRGVLVLFALQDRKFGIAKTTELPQSVADDIKRGLQGRVTDLLKSGDVDRAMILAADVIADKLPASKPAAGTGGSPSGGPTSKSVTRTVHERRHQVPQGVPHMSHSSGGSGALGGLLCGGVILFLIVMVVVSLISSVAHGFGRWTGGGNGGYPGGYGGGWGGGGGGGFLPGMLTGGLLGYLFGGGGHSGWGGGGWGSGWHQPHTPMDFTDTTTTTTETWSGGGSSGGGFSDFGGGGGGGFDSFGGGNFDGGGASGEW